MDLWIRSQNKKVLKKINNVNVGEVFGCIDKYSVFSFLVDDLKGENIVDLGYYKTEKRAIEILDEIQDSMYDTYETMGSDGNVLVRTVRPKQDNFIVYQMPADDEVK